jgi:hypothetical protein
MFPFGRIEGRQVKGQTVLNIFVYGMLGLMITSAPALAAVEQCRFIQAKPEREACYERQAIALAAKRKPDVTGDTKTFESLRQMKQEDDAVNQSLRSICRGC